ncbi:MAG: ATP-dependent helicase HrpB [Spirochaetales bacterium]|nr:ATP-dependent helicase HrpB [Spirochaetales bacterium]
MELRPIDLPVAARLDDIARALAASGALVLRAEPGAGKTSLVPPFLASRAVKSGRVLVLEPRRVAAAQGAARVAELSGGEVGGFAGFRVRGEARVSRATRVEFLTEGLLVRTLQSDPGLEGVDCVVLDEFHERSIHADLALALLLELRELRPELELVLMSATIEAERIGDFVGAPVFEVPGRAFPVETRWMPGARPERFEAGAVAAAVREALDSCSGDILCFLPGLGEISRVAGELAGLRGVETRVLHGGLSLGEQRGIVLAGPGGPRRVVLSTSVAETSLTVPRVCAAVDAGWSRHGRFHIGSGMNRLVTERVSSAQAAQRAGRAGRLGPGLCVRAWSESEALKSSLDPEILRSELSGPALEALLWGSEPEALRWLDPPPESAWNAARELLADLGALGPDGRPTALGKAAAALGLEPRLGVLVAREAPEGGSRAALSCAAAALLGDRDPGTADDDPDFRLRLERLRSGARDERYDRVRAEAARIARNAGLAARGGASGGAGFDAADEASAGALLAEAFPDRVARLEGEGADSRPGQGVYAFRSGRRAALRGSLSREEWIVAVDADSGETAGAVRLAAPLSKAEALEVLAPRSRVERTVQWKGWKARMLERRVSGRLVLSERSAVPSDSGAVGAAACERVAREGVACLPFDEAARAFLDRVRYASRSLADPGGRAWDDASLAADAREWLGSWCVAGSGDALDSGTLLEALRARLGREAMRSLDREFPARFVSPAGRSRAIAYPASGDAFCELRIQEVFGTAESPRVGGRPLVLKLLSPADRPLQVTADLASFWRSAYPELRGPMRARYPKHFWPENPLESEPTKGMKPQG